MHPQLMWWISRSMGMVAAVLLVASLVWGVLLATRVLKPLDRPAWLLALHRWLSTLACIGIAGHLLALVADNYTHFGWREVFVPMGSSWKALPVTLGVIAMYILIVVQGTSMFIKKMPRWAWKSIHMLSYAAVWLSIVHGALAGTDASNRAYQAVALMLTIIAITAAMLRILVGTSRSRRVGQSPGCDRLPAAPGDRSDAVQGVAGSRT